MKAGESRARGLGAELLDEVVEGVTLEVEDTRKNYGETRIICYGYLVGRMAVVGYTLRGDAHAIKARECLELPQLSDEMLARAVVKKGRSPHLEESAQADHDPRPRGRHRSLEVHGSWLADADGRSFEPGSLREPNHRLYRRGGGQLRRGPAGSMIGIKCLRRAFPHSPPGGQPGRQPREKKCAMNTVIRQELPSDVAAIHSVTVAAFLNAPHTAHTEQFIVAALRNAGASSISLVAERAGEVVGHVAVSPVSISDGSAGWYGLGPISVKPELQRKGIGSLLMQAALGLLRERGAAGCVLVGDPAYYSRFGFRPESSLMLPHVPPEYFQALPFGPSLPRGVVTFHEAFNGA